MSSRAEAAEYDRRDSPLDAIRAYERAIEERDADVEAFLDLAVLYFVCTDPGYCSHHGLSDEFVNTAWERSQEILRQAEERFGWHVEITFWRHEFDFMVLGRERPDDVWEELARRGGSLLPHAALFLASGGTRYRDEAKQLLESVKDGGTARRRYVKSLLETKVMCTGESWSPRSQDGQQHRRQRKPPDRT